MLQEADVGFVFSTLSHPSLTHEPLAECAMVCVVPKGLLPARKLRLGLLSLADLVDVPVINLDARDPVGTRLSQACREAGVGLNSYVTVQTYHAALAMAHHGLGVALVDACTAVSADRSKVEVLALEPAIHVPVQALRLADKPGSVLVRALTEEMQQAIRQALRGLIAGAPQGAGCKLCSTWPCASSSSRRPPSRRAERVASRLARKGPSCSPPGVRHIMRVEASGPRCSCPPSMRQRPLNRLQPPKPLAWPLASSRSWVGGVPSPCQRVSPNSGRAGDWAQAPSRTVTAASASKARGMDWRRDGWAMGTL